MLAEFLNLCHTEKNPVFTTSLRTSSQSEISGILDVPDPVDQTLVQQNVVDLLRVRLTWLPPRKNNADITSYTVSYCHQLTYNSDCLPVFELSVLPNNTVGTTEAERHLGQQPCG